ncbi:hypothetical protein NGR_c14450 [Sinorhizobium fredii NGR234]|uniref:Uncharacterized protein n=1 Tax=Sinorhizobium fredii (strain NBRC 101917 / NGR234) TaxID=394 RepID=C3MCD8_SINFN|nr:hypothetical protein [Sinorhizobium fredii]ACP25217.1 hypothetical protein NGR_c14450 [Sinorhizobium fredii NGR234]
METSAIDNFRTPALGWWLSYRHVYSDTNHLSAIILPHRYDAAVGGDAGDGPCLPANTGTSGLLPLGPEPAWNPDLAQFFG